MNVSVTATRNIKFHEAAFAEEMLALPPGTRVIVGACRGGDCAAAIAALGAGLEVHTVVPSIWKQLCPHWKDFVEGRTQQIPHSTTQEFTFDTVEPYRRRNERLVELGSDLLLAFPDSKEQEARSGVTMTINIARKRKVPVKVHILHP